MNDETTEVELMEEITEEPEQLKLIEATRNELKSRCKAANIEIQILDDLGAGPEFLRLNFPAGRDKRRVFVIGLDEIKAILSIPFENYVFLGDYEAICSYTEGTIEAVLKAPGSFNLICAKLTGTSIGEVRKKPIDIALDLKALGDIETERITIAPTSKSLQALKGAMSQGESQLAIRMTGLKISQYDQALEYLERVANSLFFQIDIELNLPFTLMKERSIERPIRKSTPRKKPEKLRFPCFEYDQAPVSLYWYARGATGMPLLQFLAYYQSVEFYFPIYSQAEAQQKVRNILKDPSFNPHKDTDIGRVLSAVKAGNSKSYGDERTQLRAALQHCVNADELRQFFTKDEARNAFFSAKSKTVALSSHKIPLASTEADLRNDVADRIYDIRCKIVHTKNGSEDDEVKLLLPFSKEAAALGYDVELMQYISRQVLIASSHPFRLSNQSSI